MKMFIETTGAKHPNTGETGFVIVLENDNRRMSEEVVFASSEGEVVKYLMTSFDSFESYVEIRKEIKSYRSAL
jgi:hypothetical protein